MISHGKLFDIPQFDNIECDINKNWLKRGLKERDPNKLGTRNISSYQGKVSKALMDAMRELNISMLPPLKETSQNKQVITELGNCLTQARFTLRDLIIKSMQDEVDISKIADLAHAIIGKTEFKPTVHMYMCLAFLRWMYEKYPTLDGNKWWIKVDDSLVTMQKKYTTETELSKYREDIKKYGDPSDSERKVTPTSLLPGWQVMLQAHAKKVETASSGSTGGRKSKKWSAPDL
ncbi:hypothetical protein PILCRDRAFT_10515 [Piloderma croceum F 1598]|uniref:Uncharacterized protein n=1 Tax=Piloderma croceum (strain F 1598) TaxID=765440 RepID=A0A0C3F3N7_PILCF|nr:hypothetical protein PILCRDRAFT_10515 [Piloderma croceum F 1598]